MRKNKRGHIFDIPGIIFFEYDADIGPKDRFWTDTNKGCVTKEESDVATIRLALLGDHEM